MKYLLIAVACIIVVALGGQASQASKPHGFNVRISVGRREGIPNGADSGAGNVRQQKKAGGSRDRPA
ncbi:MAG: hypothetical protein KKH67_03470 [candidate division Zixibacteria bacterium]|nr:hypothetical protein [candidate division Zixibacteria bacterium]MBU1470169.1 hypothetical protein [candidate division Zixibacteria bacterium]